MNESPYPSASPSSKNYLCSIDIVVSHTLHLSMAIEHNHFINDRNGISDGLWQCHSISSFPSLIRLSYLL